INVFVILPASVCPSCILCEMCRHSHDPSHNLVRTKTPLSIPEHGMSGELRFPRRGDRTVRKAERQRLKAERRQLRAEVKEIKKKLRLEKRGLQWSGHSLRSSPSPRSHPCPGLFSTMLCTLETRGPGVSHTSLVPTMAALFLDENLPDGTNLEPGTKFIKYWKMKNTGSICWTSETKLVFMWGNLSLASEEKREVPVPLLPPGHVGMVSVALVAPVTDGTYTSHWRLAHCGSQFGPRVWCSIVVKQRDKRTGLRHQRKRLARKSQITFFITAACLHSKRISPLNRPDLLSFELLDLNFADDLEKVPHNTPADLTPCISPLPYCTVVLDKSSPSPKKEETEISGVFTPVAQEEERDDEISGAQFLCETVMRSLALEEAPDHRPPRRLQRCCHEPKGEEPTSLSVVNIILFNNVTDDREEKEEDGNKGEDWDEISSQISSVSSDDYSVILPDCFDTSRPLGESMYSSAMSQPGTGAADVASDKSDVEQEEEEDSIMERGRDALLGERQDSVNQMLCASQTVDEVTLNPEVVPSPDPLLPPHCTWLTIPVLQPVTQMNRINQESTSMVSITHSSHYLGNTFCPLKGLVKGALSVAASAYKALFTGPNPATTQGPSKMDQLLEMGFRDQRMNRRLLKKHFYSLEHTVDELVQLAENRRNRYNVT
uniref:NBR1 autophagy cargo receptor a n=1 Tax=Oreochromis niloticus TaxID=8128 RepID=I3KPF3_ORENI